MPATWETGAARLRACLPPSEGRGRNPDIKGGAAKPSTRRGTPSVPTRQGTPGPCTRAACPPEPARLQAGVCLPGRWSPGLLCRHARQQAPRRSEPDSQTWRQRKGGWVTDPTATCSGRKLPDINKMRRTQQDREGKTDRPAALRRRPPFPPPLPAPRGAPPVHGSSGQALTGIRTLVSNVNERGSAFSGGGRPARSSQVGTRRKEGIGAGCALFPGRGVDH